MPPPTQFSGTFYGDYIAIAATNRTAYPIWADSRPVDLFLCPGTGTTTTPPAVCQAGAPNASVANDEDIYTTPIDLKLATKHAAPRSRGPRRGRPGLWAR
jgi:hypothetical protein